VSDKKTKISYVAEREQLRNIGRHLHDRGWSVGTSSNYSTVVAREPLFLLITASGKDKGNLGKRDFAVLNGEGQPTDEKQPRSSAESQLHVTLARSRGAGAVLHTHSVWGTLLSDLCFDAGQIEISGYEMLKGLEGIETHDATATIKIYDNTQDIAALAEQLASDLAADAPGLQHGFLLRGHGLYTWGHNLFAAKRHLEVLEFLFEVTGRKLSLQGAAVVS
jgi:methylthioribulose-1-phosphate dehydratase